MTIRRERHLHSDSVVRVGHRRRVGRGFIVQNGRGRLVITAAHCLPRLPPCHLAAFTEEKTYPELLGPIGGKLRVMAECLFVNPVDDIAIVGPPDGQVWPEQHDEYEALTEAVTPIQIREGKIGESVWLLGLDGRYKPGVVADSNERFLNLQVPEGVIEPGMSGSPILGKDGCAVSICAVSALGPSPVNLVGALPGWFGKQRLRRSGRHS